MTSYLWRVFSQCHIVTATSCYKYNGRHSSETLNPLWPLFSLSAHIKHAINKHQLQIPVLSHLVVMVSLETDVIHNELGFKHSTCLNTATKDVFISRTIVFSSHRIHFVQKAKQTTHVSNVQASAMQLLKMTSQSVHMKLDTQSLCCMHDITSVLYTITHYPQLMDCQLVNGAHTLHGRKSTNQKLAFLQFGMPSGLFVMMNNTKIFHLFLNNRSTHWSLGEQCSSCICSTAILVLQI